MVVCLSVSGDTSVNYSLLLEVKYPRGVKQQMLKLLVPIGRLFVVDAVLNTINVLLSLLGCIVLTVIFAEALPRGSVQMLMLRATLNGFVALGLKSCMLRLLRRGVTSVVPVNPELNLLNDRNRLWLLTSLNAVTL